MKPASGAALSVDRIAPSWIRKFFRLMCYHDWNYLNDWNGWNQKYCRRRPRQFVDHAEYRRIDAS